MVNKNLYKMKQPELGRKILEWRKAKGLTQEELVDLCQINVRTIQRIEAGEVTPRPFTLKTIMEALGIENEDINTIPATEEPKHESPLPANLLRISFMVGIVYLIFAVIESFLEFTIWEDSFFSVSGLWYSFVKITVMVTFTIFIYGYFSLAKQLENHLVRIGAILLVVGIILSTAKDLYVFYFYREAYLQLAIMDAIYFGAVYILFGIGMLNYQKTFGPIALIAGCLGILTGIAFVSILFALPGLILLTIFEILLLVILYSASHKLGSTKISDPSYSFSN
jgi:transcriptional regulator with XRE-family HTH domain